MTARGPEVIVTGSSGLLGPYLAREASALGVVVGLNRSSGDIRVDLTDEVAVRRALEGLHPATVIHAAALTDVDWCERDPAGADAHNRAATDHLARHLPESTTLVVVSTDQVYPDEPGPHAEGVVGPVNEYGRSKLAGELAGLARPSTLVVRTNFFGPSLTPGRSSLSDFMIGRLVSGESLPLFNDVSFSPLHVQTVATMIVRLIQSEYRGVVNLGGRNGMTKAEFGARLARHLDLPFDGAFETASDCLPSRAPRPHDLRMEVEQVERVLGCEMPTVDEEVTRL